MSAYAAKARLVLAQPAVADQTPGITAIPALRALLQFHGTVVTSDAMGGQQAIARTLVEAGADSVLAVKDNHSPRSEEVRRWLETEPARGRLPHPETVETGHGRLEIRRYALSEQLEWRAPTPEWAGLRAVGRVESTRLRGDNTSTECRYYRCSFTDPTQCAAAVRGHWGLENGQHWVRDVQFGEDDHRACRDHSAEDLALVRRMALKVIRYHGPAKDRRRRRKLRASRNDDYRARLIFGPQST